MSASERFSNFWNRFLGRIRHPDAQRVNAGSRRDFEELEGHKHCLVVTYRRSGDAVPTPVWFGQADGHVYFRTEGRSAKIKRIRANPRALVAPCDSRGKPLGPATEARARVLTQSEEAGAEAAIQSNFGLGRRMYEGVAMKLGPEGVYVEISPAPGDAEGVEA